MRVAGALGRWLRRIALGVVAALVVLIGGVWVERSLPIELPRPSGPLPVGRTSRALSPTVVAWIWYPANHAERVAAYLPDSIRVRWMHDRPGVINTLTRDLGKVRAHGVFDAPFGKTTEPSPVLLFRGGGGGGVLSYTSLFEELASHGYVVVALEARDAGNPEACVGGPGEDACATKLIDGAVRSMGAAIDRLTAIEVTDTLLAGHLDMRTVGVFGHSFGGAQTLAFCAVDPRCAAGVNIDGRLFGSLERTRVTVPFLWLLSDHGSGDDSVSRQIMGQIQSVYEREPADRRMRIAIRGANHFTFSEDGAMLKTGVLRGIMRLIGVLSIGGRRQIEVSSYAVRSFFDMWMPNRAHARGALVSPSYPEIIQIP